MALAQPPSTPVPAPALNVPGLSCTGTICGDSVNYECRTVPVECGTLTKYKLEHLLKPQFWILSLVILYVMRSEDAYQLFLRVLAKLHLGPNERPRSRYMQITKLLVYLGILWLVWLEEYMLLSTEWRVAREIFVVWRPSLAPLWFRLLALYPVWVVICVICVVVVVLTVATITKFQLDIVKEMAFVVMGPKELDSCEAGEYGVGGKEQGGEKKENDTEATKVLVPDERN
ncbi:hypothetical protein F4679DRAFT_412501 [Xylaria curta]|nr:hypothetical protein F4679DRAFT_412501 [Xylaria curta]